MWPEVDSRPVRHHFLEQLERAELKQEPYEHFFFANAFPNWYYAELTRRLPDDDAVYTDRKFENRMMVHAADLGPFWADCAQWISECGFPVLDKFWKTIGPRGMRHFRSDVRLVRDRKGYQIKPHTDIKSKAVSLLFYLPRDDSDSSAGTSVMTSRSPGFKSAGDRRYEFEDFDTVWTAPFLPNSVLGFPRSDVSFHGVKPTTPKVRDVLLLNIYAGSVEDEYATP